MDEKLKEDWRVAIQKCGGVAKFEKETLPLCSDVVRVCYEKIVKREMQSSG